MPIIEREKKPTMAALAKVCPSRRQTKECDGAGSRWGEETRAALRHDAQDAGTDVPAAAALHI